MTKLYTFDDLLQGYDLKDKMSYLRTWDFVRFSEYTRNGGAAPPVLKNRIDQATHDANISDALQSFLIGSAKSNKPLVGIMASHSTSRGDPAYKAVADLTRELTRNNFLVATGGGPGGMEAGNFGAYFANSSDQAYVAAYEVLKRAPVIPDFRGLLDDQGVMVPGKEPVVQMAHDWLTAGIDASKKRDGAPGESLAIATWLYGAEPTMPFATSYAKYYFNSIREEALVHGASAGIVYARGGGGTIREIFQDVEQNYYAPDAPAFTPMIFFDPAGYWQNHATFKNNDPNAGAVETRGLKLDKFMRRIFCLSLDPAFRGAALKKILFTTNTTLILDCLRAQSPKALNTLSLVDSGKGAKLFAARWRV